MTILPHWLLAAICAAFAWLAFTPMAHAQQLNEKGCAYVADVAVTARALSGAGVERPLAEKILQSMYTAPDATIQKIRVRVTDAAYMSEVEPAEYSQKLFLACLQSGGQMDKFLGLGV